MLLLELCKQLFMSWADSEGGRQARISQVAICFLRNSGTDPPRNASRGRIVWPSLKYVED